MFQDLWIINETVPNPYVILEEIPPSAKWFTVLDLQDALFCIPLARESQYIFAFEWETPGEKRQQMTWTVLVQREPHCLGMLLASIS